MSYRLYGGPYPLRLVKGFLFSLAGLCGIVWLGSQLYGLKLETVGGGEAVFYMLVVGPSEELIFRFFVPLLVMYWLGVGYLVGGVIAAVGFGYAHWYAYGGEVFLIGVAAASGVWQAVTVYLFSSKEPFNFSPGLLAAILGHGAYDVAVSYDPQNLLWYALASSGLLGFLAYSTRGEED